MYLVLRTIVSNANTALGEVLQKSGNLLPVFFQGFWKGIEVKLKGVNTIFPSMSDTFNWFSQRRKFPSKYA